MKLLRIGAPGRERPVARTDDGSLWDLSELVDDFGGGSLLPGSLEDLRTALASGDLPTVVDPVARVGAPITRPGKVVCIGLNYRAHAAESGVEPPSEPVLFMKDPATVIGPEDEVLVPRRSVKTDYEVELGVVIGSEARYLDSAADGLACIAGYAVSHDVSEREFQLERGGQWVKGKSCETFNPLGPWLVTADEIADPQDLQLSLWVNGERRQHASTSDMIFGVGELVRYVSQFMVLEPGDLINTGTPAGVALGFPEPKPYLRAGDVVEVEIAGLGRQKQPVGQA